jgi:hypothetical protein
MMERAATLKSRWTTKGPPRKLWVAAPEVEGEMRCAVAVKSTPSLALPGMMAHLTGMPAHSRRSTMP